MIDIVTVVLVIYGYLAVVSLGVTGAAWALRKIWRRP